VTPPRLDRWLEETLPGTLPAFLPARRWFGGKADGIAGVTFEDAAWLPASSEPCALVVVGVRQTSGDGSRYVLIVKFVREAGSAPVLGPVEDGREAAVAVEAAGDPQAAQALLRGFRSSGDATVRMIRGGHLRYGDADPGAARVMDAEPPVKPMGAEQSNSSLAIDQKLSFKLVRRLEDGENPELEIGRFLATRTSFRALPILRGSLTYVSARGESATVGVLQDWVDSRGDGWSYMVEQLRRQGDQAASETLKADAHSLGTVTCRFHRALATDRADPAFAPEPVTPADVVEWRSRLVERANRTTSLVGRQLASWREPARGLGERLVDQCRDLTRLGPVPDTDRFPFRKIRVHGDYHLGQTLKVADGFVMIDFEGEPGKPLADRRAKQPAAKDVAGMLRSFDYAVEMTLAGAGAGDRSAAIARHLRQRFLDGYCATFAESPPEFAPADRAAMGAWIDFFELERALYEVEYEINSRPDWVYIPLRGLLSIMNGGER
jgi:trehalose synthase-fused probable maltokinase